MDIKEMYVNEVGRHLPDKIREDIQKEIRSLIEDALEDQSQIAGRPADDEMLVSVLEKLGPPEKMAASYLPPRYLIGPTLFPTFILTLRIVVTVIAILAAIGLGVSLGAGAYLPQEVAKIIVEMAIGLFDSIFHAVGIIVIIFAVIQVTAPNARPAAEPWDPRKMKPTSDDDRVKIADPIAEIIFTVLALVVLNLYPQWIGFSSFRNGEWVHVPLMTSTFFQYLPWMSLILTLQIIQDVLLLTSGRWTAAIHWFAIAIAALTMVIGIRMLTGPSIASFDPSSIAQLGWGNPDSETIGTVSQTFNYMARVIIGIVTALQVFEIGKHGYRLLHRRLPAVEIFG